MVVVVVVVLVLVVVAVVVVVLVVVVGSQTAVKKLSKNSNSWENVTHVKMCMGCC